MFKKFAALSTAVFIVAAGLSTVAISAANADTATVTSYPGGGGQAGSPTTIFGYVQVTVNGPHPGVTSGLVNITSGTTHICSALTTSGTYGYFSCSYTFTADGTFPLTFTYSGDPGNYSASSTTGNIQIIGGTVTTTTTPSAADIAAAAAHAAEVAEQKHEAAVAAARTSLTQLFAALPVVTAPATTSGTTTPSVTSGATTTTTGSSPVAAPTLDQYAAADIHIASPTALVRVNNDVAALPVAKRADITAIQSIVKTENFVDVISSAKTQKTVTTVDLVNQGLIDPTNPNKASVVIGLTHLDPKTLTSVANIKAAIAAQLAIVQARKDRTAAILAKTQALIAKSPASK